MLLRLRLAHSIATVYSVAVPALLVLSPVPAQAAPFNPGFAVDGDPIGNALAFVIWGAAIVTAVGFTITAGLYFSARASNEPAPRVRRRVIR